MRAGSFGSRLYRFYTGLEAPRVPRGIHVMNPYADRVARRYVRAFLEKYYADRRPRLLVFGINPGRFGAGVTGVTFTDPVALADVCSIPNALPRRRELSSEFVYALIARLGGIGTFTQRVFLTAVSPLGFTKAGVNLNYYDDARLVRACDAFITRSVAAQVAAGGRRDRAVVLGAGKNLEFFLRWNDAHGWFARVDGLDHPRFIMQYRRKQVAAYLERYEAVLGGDVALGRS